MVLGEPQVLGQVKRAYEAAVNHGSVGPVLHKLFQDAIKAGKRLRSDTGIGQGRLSIGSVAFDFAHQVFDHFHDYRLQRRGTELGRDPQPQA
jgi:glutamyl-tRNA reductase